MLILVWVSSWIIVMLLILVMICGERFSWVIRLLKLVWMEFFVGMISGWLVSSLCSEWLVICFGVLWSFMVCLVRWCVVKLLVMELFGGLVVRIVFRVSDFSVLSSMLVLLDFRISLMFGDVRMGFKNCS